MTTEDALGDEVTTDDAAPTYTDWAVARTSLVRNPRAAVGLVDWSFGGGSLVQVDGALGDSGTFARFTRTVPNGTGSAFRVAGMSTIPTDGSSIAVRATVRCSVPVTIQVQARQTVTNAAPSAIVGVVALPAGESILSVVGASYVGVASSNSGIAFVLNDGGVGAVVEVTEVDVERSAVLLPSFLDGYVGGDEMSRASWTGSPNASSSILETRTAIPNAEVEDFPLSLIKRGERIFDQASNQWRTIDYYAGRVPDYVDVIEGDRIKDLADGKVYAVDEFTSVARGIGGRSSVTLKLRRTD